MMRRFGLPIALLAVAFLVTGCSSMQTEKLAVDDDDGYTPSHSYRHKSSRSYRVRGKTYHPMASSKGYREVGMASWYGHESGNRTATGARFNPWGMTAAHKTLPLPTKVRVTNLENGHSTVVTVNDRGPFVRGRIIDLSRGAARQLKMEHKGASRVMVEALN